MFYLFLTVHTEALNLSRNLIIIVSTDVFEQCCCSLCTSKLYLLLNNALIIQIHQVEKS